MKKLIYVAVCATGVLLATSCKDYLETGSPSVVDADFVFGNTTTARAAMDGAYDAWRDAAQNGVFGDGLYYALDVAGSDIERHPEGYVNQPGRHIPETFYENGAAAGSYALLSYEKEGSSGTYGKLYVVVAQSNAVIAAIESTSGYAEMIAGPATDLSQLYGEAVALRATAFRELIKYFGDVPYPKELGKAASGLSSRDSIYDITLEQLQLVEPLMFPVGEHGVVKNFFSRTYVQGLIGRMALEAGGFQTRRTDMGADFYKDGEGNTLTFETKGSENNQAVYGRRSDWQEKYNLAKTYFKKAIDNSGIAQFRTTDPRGAGREGQLFGNPYQWFFQQMNDNTLADESIYEYLMTRGGSGGNDARPYSFGRPSSGAGSNNYPCKNYGQGRINPAYYYGMFDPKDMRRDVSITVTGLDGGKGTEKMLPLGPGSQANAGGLSVSKWDEARQANPYTTGQRKSGINGPYMRMAEIYLGYAEACAATGQDAEALTYLKKVRERSFPAGQANTEAFVASCGSLLKAIIEERGFEYAGEGDRRWTLIRSGFLPEAIKSIKDMTKSMLDNLRANGYHQFSNGNVISAYVWTKLVDAKTSHGYRLTTQTPAGKENDPVLYPGWRGTNDDWAKYGLTYPSATPATNLAIEGLFEHIAPGSSEANALEAAGYTRFDWGATLVQYYDEYYTYLFHNYDYVKAPIYLFPYTPNTVATGSFTNGYGFRQD